MKPAFRVVLGVVAGRVALGALAALLLARECAYGGGMGARDRTCECLGVEWQLYDQRAADGPRRSVCVGLIRSRTCFRNSDGPVIP